MSEIDWDQVATVWAAIGLRKAALAYGCWGRRFVRYCAARNEDVLACLTRDQAFRAFSWVRVRRGQRPFVQAVGSVRALSFALSSIGWRVPPWTDPKPELAAAPPLVEEFTVYRRKHGGVACVTAREDAARMKRFLSFLRERGRSARRVRIVDVDEFVASWGATHAPKSVRLLCATLRAFMGFLRVSGRIDKDLASHVEGPRVRGVDRPPRALPWTDVCRILRAVDVRHAPGRRDYAILLTMALYGMGSAELRGLQLDDIDWKARTLRVQRVKTGVVTSLPLLDPVARALVAYIRHERPPHGTRAVFLSGRIPIGPISTGFLRERIHKYAAKAGVRASFLGTHVFRYSHAVRHVTGGASVRVVGDILGHKYPATTCAYLRGSIEGLRSVALPVPR